MAYATLADIQDQLSEAELIQLTDDAGTGEVDEDVAARAIADADAVIDGYIGMRTAVPLSAVPPILRTYSVDLAIYNLYSRRQDSMPEVRKDRYAAAMKYLGWIAEGKISMGADDPDGNPPASSGIKVRGKRQIMSGAKLRRF